MPKTCFCPGCKAGYQSYRNEKKRRGEKMENLFRAPKDDALLEKWRKAIPRADRLLTSKDFVCSLHFRDEDLDSYYEQKLFDGTTWRQEKDRTYLKKDAVPSLFPNLPKYLSSTVKKRKAPAVRASVKKICKPQKIEKIEPLISIGNDSNISIDVETTVELREKEVPHFSYNILKCKVGEIKSFPWTSTIGNNFISFLFWNPNSRLERWIIITSELNAEVFLNGVETSIGNSFQINSFEALNNLISRVENAIICTGSNNNERKCAGFLEAQFMSRKTGLCRNCRQYERNLPAQKRSLANSFRLAKRRQLLVCTVRKNLRLKKKIGKLQDIISARQKCASSNETNLLKATENLPVAQQENIKACLKAAKCKSKGMRYTYQWIYECLLIKIKSTKTYNHLRNHQILKLPTANTLNKYIRKVKGCYGFQSAVFRCLEEKSKAMIEMDRHGSLLIDEMKLSPALTFDKENLEIHGFTNLGDYTPANQASRKGDHALVLMFQPFKGKWVQSIACFLSKGAASGTVLHHLIIECIVLLERSGFFVDVVVSDGATWNRNMWKKFGISLKQISCQHICDPKRRLWFVSDFPHLIKNLRNAIVNNKATMTPDGPVDIKYWDAVLESDNPHGFNLKVCPKLQPKHVRPKYYQKMNVAMAFQFFSASVAAGMEVYKEKHKDLVGSEGCVKFVRRINDIIDGMNARTPLTALKLPSSSEKHIQEFLHYLSEWENLAVANNFHFISDSTCYGLKITLMATLEVANYLITTCNFEYLMTARLNQDSLERFFGIMRNACGSNDHPSSSIFLQVFRLIGTYSLIKPPKGSNVSGSEMLKTLLEFDINNETAEKQSNWQNKLDDIIDKCSDLPNVTSVLEETNDHNYNGLNSNNVIISYFAGYISRRASKFSNCHECQTSLVGANDGSSCNLLINIKNNNGLFIPSDNVLKLVNALESATMRVVNEEHLNINTLSSICERIDLITLPLIGCQIHEQSLTLSIVNFFLITRMHFLCDRENKIDALKNNKTKEYRKLSKLS